MDPSPPPPPRLQHRNAPPPGGGRDDCWSEGATEALVEAWGDRYVQLNRGNLRQKDWQEVADAVNEHQDALGRPRRTDVQCKNRIDTIKKKYKIEKARRGPSEWSFFSRLEELIGPSSTPTSGSGSISATLKKHQTQKPEPDRLQQERASITVKLKNKPSSNPKPLAVAYPGKSSFRSRTDVSFDSSESSHGETGGGADVDDDEDEDLRGGYEEDEDSGNFRLLGVPVPKKRRWDGRGGGGAAGSGGNEDAFGELAKAIMKFGEIYERVENSKRQQMMEMERQKMEFAKELEFQRMQMFMETQLELEKMKRPKHNSNSGLQDDESKATFVTCMKIREMAHVHCTMAFEANIALCITPSFMMWISSYTILHVTKTTGKNEFS